jgi:D-sedoheptulose 7-phosphate isomerase
MTMDATALQALFEEGRALSQTYWERHADDVLAAGAALTGCLRGGGKVLACGNGGSASQAQHFIDELVNRFERERPGIAAVALTANSSSLTSIGNDRSFDEIFSRQVDGLGARGDALVAFTTSGTSPNIVRAVESARSRDLVTVGLLGRDGGALRDAMDHPLVVPGTSTARIQEVHLEILHALCLIVENDLAGG